MKIRTDGSSNGIGVSMGKRISTGLELKRASMREGLYGGLR